MEKVIRIYILLGFALFFSQTAKASSIFFLDDGIGARGKGLGYAASTIAHEPDSVLWNPAGLSELDSPQLILESANRLGSVQTIDAAVSLPLSTRSGVGVGFVNQSVGDIELRDIDGNVSSSPTKLDSVAVVFGMGYQFSDEWRLGLSGKWIQKTFGGQSIGAFPIDIGGQTEMDWLTVSGMIQNFNEPHFGPDRITRRYICGLSVHPFGSLLMMNGDYLMSSDAHPELNLGIEVAPIYEFAFRMGYPQFSLNSFSLSRLSFGTRFVVANLILDAAYKALEGEPDYRLSVGVLF